MSNVTDWISATVGIAAFGLSLHADRSARKAQRRADELEARNVELAELQNRLAHREWSDAYFREITEWASQVSRAIALAMHVIDKPASEEKIKILAELSACIDIGRWYFPNRNHEKKGTHKEPAYRGVRQPLLDWVVFAYDVLASDKGDASSKEKLVACQRSFVSAIQAVLDPRSREQAIDQVLSDFAQVSRLPRIGSPSE